MSAPITRFAVVLTVCLLLLTGTTRAEHYAVLFCGGDEPNDNHRRYYDNTVRMYNSLVYVWHYLPENIVVLAADGDDPGFDQNLLQGAGTPDLVDSDWSVLDAATTLMSATQANLDAAMTSLPLLPRDTFLLWTYDHGSGDEGNDANTGEEQLCGWHENIGDVTLANLCADVRAGRQAYVFGQCFAGGMLQALIDANVTTQQGRFGCAAANHYEASVWYPSPGHGFMDALVEGIGAGGTRTHDIYQYALTNTTAATDGEGPEGTWANLVQHPWKVGDDMDMAVAVWMGWTNGSWTDPDNWTDGLEAGSDRTVRVRMDSGPAFPATMQTTETIRQLIVWDSGHLHVASPGSLTVTGDAVNAGTILVTSASLTVDGNMDNSASGAHLGVGNGAAVEVQDLRNAGEVVVSGLGGLSNVTVHGDANNDGSITVKDEGVLNIYGSLSNQAGASVTVQDTFSRIGVWYDCDTAGMIEVRGGSMLLVDNMLRIGSGTSTAGATVELEDGRLDVNNQMHVGVDSRGTVIARRSTLDVHTLLSVGSTDAGMLELLGSTAECMYLHVGDESGSEGDLVLGVDGANVPSVKVGGASPHVIVGRYGAGTLVQNAGALTRGDPDMEHPSPPYPEVVLGEDSEAVGVYNLNHGELHAAALIVGEDGSGTIIQRGGDAKVYGDARMASGNAANGIYQVMGGSLTAENLEVAFYGDGEVTQEEGLVTVNSLLRLATMGGSSGTYRLNGGTLRTDLIYGGSGNSRLHVDGGTLNLTGSAMWDIQELAVGYEANSPGDLALAGKTVGSHNLYVGYRAPGTLSLSACTTTVANQLFVGAYSSGVISQTGGDANVGWAYLGVSDSGTGSYTLDGGTFIVAETLHVGYDGNDSVFLQRGPGTVNADGLCVGTGGRNNTYRLEDGNAVTTGTLTLGLQAGSEGAFELAGGKLGAGGTVVGDAGEGSFHQTGGVHKMATTLILGDGATGVGHYHLDAGVLWTSGTVVGNGGTGTFRQTDGRHEILGDLAVGRAGSGSGYELSGAATGGLVAFNEIIGDGAAGTFTQTGSTNTIRGSLVLGNGVGAEGTYLHLGGGLLIDGNAAIGCGGGVGLMELAGTSLGGPKGVVEIAAGSTLRGFGLVEKSVRNEGMLDARSGTMVLERKYGGAGQVAIGAAAALEFRFDANVAGPVTSSGTLRVAMGKSRLTAGLTGGAGSHVVVDAAGVLETSCDVVGGTATVEGTVRQFSGAASLSDLLDVDGLYVLGSPASLSTQTADVAGQFTHDGGAHDSNALHVSATAGLARYNVHGGSLVAGTLSLGMDAQGVEGAGELNILGVSTYVEVTEALNLYDGGAIHAPPDAAVHFTGSDFRNASTRPEGCVDLWHVELVFEGGPSVLDAFEAAGGEMTPVRDPRGKPGGPIGAFAVGTLRLGGTAGVGRLQLVDLFENCPGWQGGERVFVHTLVLGNGSYLDLNGLELCYVELLDRGATIDLNGGSLTWVPEPASLVFVALGAFGLALRRQRTPARKPAYSREKSTYSRRS